MRYFISDLHFNHNKYFIYENRGFTNIEDMNTEYIKRFNSVVSYNDECIILGDIMLGELTDKYISKLNGNISFILGNHDTNNRIELYESLGWINLGDAKRLKCGKYTLFLCHYPVDISNTTRDNTYNIHGHTHSTKLRTGIKNYNVAADALNGFPISEEEIISKIKTQSKIDWQIDDLYNMKCPFCNNTVIQESKYCPHCGKQIIITTI